MMDQPPYEDELFALISALQKAEKLPRDTKELFTLLNHADSPLISSAVLSLLVRSELVLGGMPFAELFRLMGSSPMDYGYRQHDHRQVTQAWNTITGCVDLILDGYRACPSLRRVLDEDPALGEHFWCSLADHEDLRELLQDVFHTGAGHSLVVLHYLSLDDINDLRHDGVNYNKLTVLKKRVDLVLNWLSNQLTPEQIVSFPALITFAAEVEALGHVDLVGEGTIYNESSTNAILAANPALGLSCLCEAYLHAPVDDGIALDTFPDVVDYVSEKLPGTLDQQLIDLITGHDNASVRRGALALLARRELLPSEDLAHYSRLADRAPHP